MQKHTKEMAGGFQEVTKAIADMQVAMSGKRAGGGGSSGGGNALDKQ